VDIERFRNKQGFTLIELLMVMAIIGVLVSIFYWRIIEVKDRAYIATMESVFQLFTTHQESYYGDAGTYTADLNTLAAAALMGGFNLSDGVQFTVHEADATGWSATATHNLSTRTCAIFVGQASPPGAATHEGAVACN